VVPRDFSIEDAERATIARLSLNPISLGGIPAPWEIALVPTRRVPIADFAAMWREDPWMIPGMVAG
jgi:hypothetical protein